MSPRRPTEPEAVAPLSPHLFEILLSLSARDLHGYELIKDIRERSGGAMELGTSTLYAALRRLSSAGWIADAGDRAAADVSGGPPRRYYAITERGRAVAEHEARRLQEVARASRRILGLGAAKGAAKENAP